MNTYQEYHFKSYKELYGGTFSKLKFLPKDICQWERKECMNDYKKFA